MEEKNTFPTEQVVLSYNDYSDDTANAGRLSEDTGAEEESPVPVEQIFQNMRQSEMEILLRVGFLELDKETTRKSVTNSIADRGKSEVEVEHRHDSVIFHEENKQNSATARSDIDLPGDEGWNAPQLTAEELYQRKRQKEIETLEKAGFPGTLAQQPLVKSNNEIEANTFPSDCADGGLQNSAATHSKTRLSKENDTQSRPFATVEKLYQKIRQREIDTSQKARFLGAASSSTLLMSGGETQSEPDKMTVEEFFQSIRQHDVNILVRSGYPGASYYELDSDDSASDIVTSASFQGEIISPEDMVDYFTSAVYGCFPCCYYRRMSKTHSNPDKTKEKNEKNKRPSLLRRLRQFLTRTFFRRRE
ncbi:uncharacterized protein [Magallana gigas]|uniref:uncharacterized protein n=1 Tax=Magallana gigas TaxID=29159 RepID=UPI003340E813